MTRQEIEACFLLAGIRLYAATPTKNTYPGSQLIRGPRWLCDTNLGQFVIGWRKRVVEIDWSGIGKFTEPLTVKRPMAAYLPWLHKDDTDQGATYIHAYSLPAVAVYLSAFVNQRNSPRFSPIDDIQ